MLSAFNNCGWTSTWHWLGDPIIEEWSPSLIANENCQTQFGPPDWLSALLIHKSKPAYKGKK